jgi:hypothetical protein
MYGDEQATARHASAATFGTRVEDDEPAGEDEPPPDERDDTGRARLVDAPE